MKRKIFAYFLLCFVISLKAQHQQSLNFGFKGEISSDVTTSGRLAIGVGVGYENQILEHHGFVIELNYRNIIRSQYYPVSLGFLDEVKVREDYISLPVMYKFYSNIINVSTGPTFDYFISWKEFSQSDTYVVKSYSIIPAYSFGWIFKLSKSFNLSQKMVLEPEIYLNPIFGNDYCYYGGTIKLKYKL